MIIAGDIEKAPCCASCAEGGNLGDPLIWWPGSIASLLEQVDTEIQGIARDVAAERAKTATTVVSDLQLAGWKAFYNEWAAFKRSASTWTGATVDRAREYQKRAAQWRSQLAAGGMKATGPAPGVPGASQWPGVVKWAAGAAIVVGGAYAVGKLVGVFGGRR